MNAEEYLEQIGYLDEVIEKKESQREEWFTKAISTTAPITERVQTSSNGNKLENATIKYMEEVEKIDNRVYELRKERQKILDTIEKLNNKNQLGVLYKIYVEYDAYETYQKIADAYGKSYNWVNFIKGRAIKNLQKILDEMECDM